MASSTSTSSAGISVSSVGHCHPAVVAAIREQAGSLLHVGNLYYTEPMARLAARLAESSLGGKVFFANSGAEAVEAAIKCARKARQGGTIVSLHGAFHGRTYGALSATPQESKQAPFAPLVPGFVSVDPTIDALAGAVDGATAAVIIEPIQGESGVHVLPDELLVGARELLRCVRRDADLRRDADRPRAHRHAWGYEHSGVVPDPDHDRQGARRRPADRRADHRPAPRRHVRAGRPRLDLRRAARSSAPPRIAVLDVLLDEALLARVRELGEMMRERLALLPHVVEVRGRGLMNAIELDVDAPAVVRRALLEQHLVVNATGPTTVRFLPPLVIGEAEIEDCLERMAAVLG